jgi:hypothetical protein
MALKNRCAPTTFTCFWYKVYQKKKSYGSSTKEVTSLYKDKYVELEDQNDYSAEECDIWGVKHFSRGWCSISELRNPDFFHVGAKYFEASRFGTFLLH